jgi:CubicO group peptidase (beta-lactamase class C family)
MKHSDNLSRTVSVMWTAVGFMSALALFTAISMNCSARESTPQAKTLVPDTGPIGRWAGTGVEVDGFGSPLEISRIELEFDGSGNGTIDYPTLGCAGSLKRLRAAGNLFEYRETLTTGIDKCPSGGVVSLRAVGDRWVYNWSVEGDWMMGDAPSRRPSPSLPGTGPDGNWIRSGVLTSQSAPSHNAFSARDLGLTTRIASIENGIVPPVLVNGEPAPKTTLADRMAALRVPGVSVAVIHNGRIDWARSYGVTKIGGAPVTTQTLFQAASISKPLTALVVMRLAQEKLLDLDMDANTYLKSWKIPQNSFTSDRAVTLRRLLSHTAGVSVHGFAGYAAGEPIPTLLQILNGEKPANSLPIGVDTEPGTLWRYSGGGYVIIRQTLEDVTGQPFAELARKTVLAPLGMTHSTFEQPLPAAQLNDAASPYAGDGQPVKGGAHVYPEVTPDGLWTTPTDLARFALAIQASLEGRSNAILSQSVAHEMLEPGGLADWGLGWGLGGTSGHAFFWHSGSNAGFKSMLFAYRDGEGAVVMTNSDSGEKLASDLVRTIAYEYEWPDFGPEQIAPVPLVPQLLDRLSGRYRLGRFSILTITHQGDRLFAVTADRPKFRIYPKSKSEWFAVDPDGFTPNPDVQISFHMTGPDAVSGLVIRQKDADIAAPRLNDVDADKIEAELAARVKSQKEAPGSEEAMRRYIEELAKGQPDYTQMSPQAAYITRLILLNFAAEISKLGALQSLTFKDVSASGENEFVAKFDNGMAQAQILCAEEGKIESVLLMSPAFM